MPHTTAFARNQWYVAAHSHEVGRDLLGRTVLGEPLVLYRSEEDGTPGALHDRCVHRRCPLSEPPTRLDGDRIVCGYHGFTYDTTGTCVYVPGQKRVPRTARIASYPVLEQDSLVWVWIGDPALADIGAVPRARHLDSPGWVTVRGMEPIDADYGLLVDNLLDLSHETYLHGGHICTPEVAETPITTEVDEGAGIVRVSRHMDDAECPPFYAKSTGIGGGPPGLGAHRRGAGRRGDDAPLCVALSWPAAGAGPVTPAPAIRRSASIRATVAGRGGRRTRRTDSTRGSCPAACSSGWPSPGHWPRSPKCC
ncbi:Rieske 2Fe-2S domain-containing protein [Streptomyces mutabilis]|uniref:Rieske 2Fe-2S domain-containing protein n=1 Tax=Streptomyces mutabilis TaxID=67332 RepID=UPI000B2EBDDB|nr:Rieske 2Fe-2S domain-containing protein [Streptomyces mutabilis]